MCLNFGIVRKRHGTLCVCIRFVVVGRDRSVYTVNTHTCVLYFFSRRIITVKKTTVTACNNNLYYGLRGVFYLPRGRRVPKTHVRHPQTVSEGLDGAVGMCARNRAPMNHVIIMLLVYNARRTPGVPALFPSLRVKGFLTDTVFFFFFNLFFDFNGFS